MFLEEFLVILKSISIIKAPKILPKIKDFEVFVARWEHIDFLLQTSTKKSNDQILKTL